MSQSDFEDRSGRSLRITDPSGNTSMINKGVEHCTVCGNECKYSSSNECAGKTHFLNDVKEHLCEHHQVHGAPNNWYVSRDTNKVGPVQRMIGEADEQEMANWGGTYRPQKDDQDDGEDFSKED